MVKTPQDLREQLQNHQLSLQPADSSESHASLSPEQTDRPTEQPTTHIEQPVFKLHANLTQVYKVLTQQRFELH